MIEFISKNETETYELGERLGREAKPGEVYALLGDLGAGKTLFAKGFAKGLGVTEPVNSPTFTVLQVYPSGRLALYHFDVYRLEEPEEMEEIGGEEFFYGDGVCLVEWADRIAEWLPPKTRTVYLERIPGDTDDARRILYTEAGEELPPREK